MNIVKNEQSASYDTTDQLDHIIRVAMNALTEHFTNNSLYALRHNKFTNPEYVKIYLTLKLAQEVNEQFVALFLDNQHRLISHECLFTGTINISAVYPRVVAQRSIEIGAAAVIFAHNHPSGITEPSQADKQITEKLKKSLELFDIRVLDHIIVGNTGTYSFSEHGLIQDH